MVIKEIVQVHSRGNIRDLWQNIQKAYYCCCFRRYLTVLGFVYTEHQRQCCDIASDITPIKIAWIT